MRNTDRITAVLLLIVSAAFAVGALRYYRWWGHDGPGPAFLPFWLGVVMACLGALMLFRSSKEQIAEWMPRGEARKRVFVVLGVTAAFIGLLKVLGMVVGTALFLIVLLRYLGRHRWRVTIAIALAAAGLNWLVFVHWLRVPMPEGLFWTF
ncbi:MAG TPA: tripartite tricarboxylate transporter TctB family protein [Burkholderiales bacterium]|nr:tripartite tricarboxylate transporter TctB family protein [Burkholderiales bacterium]